MALHLMPKLTIIHTTNNSELTIRCLHAESFLNCYLHLFSFVFVFVSVALSVSLAAMRSLSVAVI